MRPSTVNGSELLATRLKAAGLSEVERVTPVTGGVAAVAGLAQLASGSVCFAKTLVEPEPGLFHVEAEGLAALRELGGAATPAVRQVTDEVLVLERLWPRPDTERYWEQCGRLVAALHTRAVGERFGWQRDGWLGRLRQHNTWHEDGHAFFAQRRLLRYLPEPPVAAALGPADRRALEHLCARLPELVPVQPPVLTHGDFWSSNLVAGWHGEPVLVDPAVSYTWAEVDLSMFWSAPRPPEAERFFAVYHEVAGLRDGWRERMPLLNLRELLCIVAHGDDDWGAAEVIRETLAPFRRQPRQRGDPGATQHASDLAETSGNSAGQRSSDIDE